MYERNAIVLERYFYKLFKYKENSNLKQNYSNYCNLVEKFENFKNATEAERVATEEFEKASDELKKVQKSCEKLYNKSAKLEYSRYIIFENIEEKPETVQRCLEKIEKDVDKNVASLKSLDEEFMQTLKNYKEKKEILFNCQEENKKAKTAYEKILNKTSDDFENILEEDITLANDFINSENKDRKKELNTILTENGINEKNPFDPDVLTAAVNVSFEIYVKEIEIFLNVYERTKKLLSEIAENDVKLEKHKKLINDSNARIHFINAEKDYIIGFLDNERIAAIYDKKVHRKLMLEACRNFEADLVHINSLYDIILKEIASRSSKRLYKENYNKSYLADIEKASETVGEEAGKLKANAFAVMNLNYWRIDGISKIQEVFEKDVTEIYGRDLKDIFPEEKLAEPEAIDVSSLAQDIFEEETEKNTESAEIKPKYQTLKSSKSALKNAINKFSSEEHSKLEDSDEKDEILEKLDEIDEFDEKVSASENAENNDLFEKISMLDDDSDDEELKSKIEKKQKEMLAIKEDGFEADTTDEDDNEEEEESILDFYFKQPDLSEQKRKKHDEKKLNSDDKVNFFQKIIGINNSSKSKHEA